jgi:salicylate biosynthesis isochorismate synthase/menaquinone-specific isochorismate synthase
VRRARALGREVAVALTVPVAGDVDPTPVVCASRRPGEPWFCFEQPDRGGSAVAALGSAHELTAAGPDRFARVAAAWRRLAASAAEDEPDDVPGTGPIAAGGFAFAPSGGASRTWEGFAPASLCVPELTLARRGGEVRLTLIACATADDTVEDLVAGLEARLSELRAPELPMLDPAPTGRYEVASALPPGHYESAVQRGVERIRAGAMDKLVLAREVQVHSPTPHDPAAAFGVLREAFPACYVACAGRGDGAFLLASPELLVRREGRRASTLALAGSTRRSADPAVDAHLGEQLLRSAKDREEQEIVVRRIERTLRPHAVWLAVAPEPALVSIANIQHLATPIRAQLRRPVSTLELVGLMHPTPAVGGEPWAAAERVIPELEGLDRGWYAGPVGWTDAREDGEFCVGLRCALLRGETAHCYAGVGVVRDSDPAAELAETEVKLEAMLPVLAG